MPFWLTYRYLPTGERVVEEPLHANDEGYFLSDNPPDRLLRVPRSPEPRPSWTLASLLPGSRRRLSLELIEAAKRGDIEDIKRLYHERADINYQEMDNESATALHIAVSNGHYHAVCALVECGCNVNCLMKDRKSPLHIAVQSNNPQIAQYLLTNTYNRANVDAADSSGEVGLFYTSWTNMADVLLRNGAKPNIPNHEGVTPLHRAVRSGFPLDHVRLLLHYKADPNAMDRNGMTPLSMACDFQDEDTEDERYDVVSALLEHGAEVNLTVHGCDDWTPLHFAAAHGYSRILRKLALSPRGGRSALRVVSAEGFTPLHQAVADHRLQCVEALMSLLTGINGALEVQCNEGRTPLHWAVALHTPGDADALTRLLLRAGANASAVDNQGRTPLFYAFSRDVVDQLCEKGADLFRRDPYGATPLHFVALFGSVDAADRLVELGISPTVKDNEHLTPLEFLCREERFWDTEAKWDGAAEFPGRFEMVKHFTSRKWQLPSTTCYAVVSRWKNRSIATQVQKYLDSQCTTVEESLVSWSSFLTAGAAVATGWAVAPVAGVGIAALLGARTVQRIRSGALLWRSESRRL